MHSVLDSGAGVHSRIVRGVEEGESIILETRYGLW